MKGSLGDPPRYNVTLGCIHTVSALANSNSIIPLHILYNVSTNILPKHTLVSSFIDKRKCAYPGSLKIQRLINSHGLIVNLSNHFFLMPLLTESSRARYPSSSVGYGICKCREESCLQSKKCKKVEYSVSVRPAVHAVVRTSGAILSSTLCSRSPQASSLFDSCPICSIESTRG